MGTRDMDGKEEERAGLAGKHAYAVLDVVEVYIYIYTLNVCICTSKRLKVVCLDAKAGIWP